MNTMMNFTNLIIAIFALSFSSACASAYKDMRHRSPHFKDGKFVNPVPSDKSLWKFLSMRLQTDYADWPESIKAKTGKINPAKVFGGNIHVNHINHSTLMIQTAGYNILTDPIYSQRCSPVSWAGPKRVREPGVPFDKLPKVDIIIISHDHYDHLDLDTIKRLVERDNPKIFLGLGVGERLASNDKVLEMDWWESAVVSDDLTVHFVPVQHFSGRGLFDRNSTLWGGFVLETKDRKIYFGGDSGYAAHYKETFDRFGPMDLALLPIGAFKPRWFMSYAHLDPDDAVKAHLDLQAQLSIGIHYGTFQLTAEAIDEPIIELGNALTKYGVNPEEFITAEFGKTIKLHSDSDTKDHSL